MSMLAIGKIMVLSIFISLLLSFIILPKFRFCISIVIQFIVYFLGMLLSLISMAFAGTISDYLITSTHNIDVMSEPIFMLGYIAHTYISPFYAYFIRLKLNKKIGMKRLILYWSVVTIIFIIAVAIFLVLLQIYSTIQFSYWKT